MTRQYVVQGNVHTSSPKRGLMAIPRMRGKNLKGQNFLMKGKHKPKDTDIFWNKTVL